ncbi:MAG: SDR family oxidoreductase [Proteobacteria bacterium]|nr:SDR family oxidoreductase [Pseudomonadota bacterium]MBU1386757.1 SDR family oxidoreductase [Pseudomonadota bacterium]MBU1544701.1 SDR family oxidoreductase [Pseudomonadota bacterium]MBU2430107.1 SDR family oxidoreductase [Pseudomonadota bacterium]MBU2480558.1 SDR family oxidoreductase [Pseudomonadota bacterium]
MRSNKTLFDLSGQVAIITGGATGIGLQMSCALGEAGADIVIAARNVSRCRELADKMESDLGISVLPAQVDICDPESIRQLYHTVMERFSRVDILINNSGTVWDAPSLEYPLEAWEKVIRVNLTGTWLMSKEAARIMVPQNYGRIINISSLAAFVGASDKVMDTVSYQASKAGVIGLTKDLAVKWAKYNITVNSIAPGWFPTKLSSGALDLREEILLKNIPLGRFGGDDELKGAALFLASPGAAYCTGTTLNVDGGWVAQ